MKEMDCVEVIVEKEEYAEEGVHKGMQGWICYDVFCDGTWLVNFPQYGEKDDIATLSVREEDMVLLPDGMDARINEQIKAKFDAAGEREEDLDEYKL